MRLIIAAALAVSVAACESEIPPPLEPTPPPTRTPPLTVSGTVFGFTATGEMVPVPNLRLKVRAEQVPDWAAPGKPLADTVTDARGRYTINDNSAYSLFFQTDPGSEYRFLCDWWPIYTLGVLELAVVHTTWSGNRLPNWRFENGSWASGTVSEQIDGSLQPVADATVTTLDGHLPVTTNPNGFFMICSMQGPGQETTVTAFKSGYNPATSEAFDGGELHFRLTRK